MLLIFMLCGYFVGHGNGIVLFGDKDSNNFAQLEKTSQEIYLQNTVFTTHRSSSKKRSYEISYWFAGMCIAVVLAI